MVSAEGSSNSSSSDNSNNTMPDYGRLYTLATESNTSLNIVGTINELGVVDDKANKVNKSSRKRGPPPPTTLAAKHREKLIILGQELWTAVRSNPSIFLDNKSSPSTTSSATLLSSSVTITTPRTNKNADDIRGSATGFVRFVAARLVLMDHIKTQDQVFPSIRFVAGVNTDRRVAIPPTASLSELEFGLRSFVRAGRSILLSDRANAREAYSALMLARECWECINYMARGGNGDVNTAIVASSVASKNLDDAFDGAALLPDAAFAASNSEGASRRNESTLVVQDLTRLDQFVKDYCLSAPSTGGGNDDDDDNGSDVSLGAIQRYLPALARVAYKHGAHYAQLKDFDTANQALKVVMVATNDSLRGIQARKDQVASRKVGWQALQVQEQEMLVVAKQSLYVLSHCSVETGRADHAQACLSQVEKYINEQRDRSEAQYTATIKNLSGDAKSRLFPSSSFAGADLLEGPKQQDKADIKARIEAARHREKQTELKERANLAFNKISLLHRASRLGREDGHKVDAEFKTLQQMVLSLPPDDATSGPSLGGGSIASMTMMASSGSKTKRKMTEQGSDDLFGGLLLRAAREIRSRRLVATNTVTNDSSCIGNPYETLLDKVDKRHPKHLFVILDHMRAVLSAIQMLREKHDNDSIVYSAGDIDLDALALSIAKQYIKGFKAHRQSLSSAGASASESTLFAGPSSAAKNLRRSLLQESITQFSRALALFHSADDRHEICHQWADLLIGSMQQLRDMEGSDGICSAGGNSNGQSVDLFASQQSMDGTLAELLSIKAYALSASGEHTLGLRTARKAWEISERTSKPSLHSAGILFHSALLQETSHGQSGGNENNIGSRGGGQSTSCDALLELDSAVSCLFQAYGDKPMDSGLSVAEELLESFKPLARLCLEKQKSPGGDRLLLGVQERWIKLFGKSKSIVDIIKNGEPTENSFADMPGSASLLSILRGYLQAIQTAASKKVATGSITPPEALDGVLESALSIILLARDRNLGTKTTRPPSKKGKKRKKKRKTFDSGNNFTLIWDDHVTEVIIGGHIDCIHIAEQLWSMASLFASNQQVVSQLYARAHDFALLSEEEEGAKLTKGFLDCDFGCSPTDLQCPNFSHHGRRDNATTASSLSSEFSAQCLIISVANSIDDGEGSRAVNKDWAKRCLHRLALAYAEMEVNELHDNENREEVRPMMAHLTLRCLIELCDDDVSSTHLADGSLLRCLAEKNLARDIYVADDDESGDGSLPIGDSARAEDSINFTVKFVENLHASATKAEAKGLRETSKILLQSCVDRIKSGSFTADSQDLQDLPVHFSVGEIQRKLIELGSNIQEVVGVFEAVDASLKAVIDEDGDGDGENLLYSKDQLDWFAVEAHNRGCQLLQLGDYQNSLRLVSCSLNLLPHCSKAASAYRAEMHSTYTSISSKVDHYAIRY